MTRTHRLPMVLAMTAILLLVSVPFASARPLAPSRVVERTVDGWFGAAVRWLEDLVGSSRSTTDRTAGSSNQKGGSGGGGGVTPTGGSCADPTGIPRPSCL